MPGARITVVGGAVPFGAGERATVPVRLENTGTEVWDSEAPAPTRASYRLIDGRGDIVVTDGPRTPFPRPVRPGESVELALDVLAPVRPGRYVVAADVVTEGLAWLDCPGHGEIDVAPPPGWARLRRPVRRPRTGSIPRVLHRVWVGGAAMPEAWARFGETWRTHHPGWEHRLWDDAAVDAIVEPAVRARCRTPAELADVARLVILAREGGVYVDTDFECRRPLDPLLEGVACFTVDEAPGNVATGIIGAVPRHPLLVRAARETRVTAGLGLNCLMATGPAYLRLIIGMHPEVTRLDPALFYPFRWDETDRRGDDFAGVVAIHHYDGSWLRQPGA